MASEEPKLEWSKELLELLRQAGPFAGTILGIFLFAWGHFSSSRNGEVSGVVVLAIAFLLWRSRRPSRILRKEAFLAVGTVFTGREEDCRQLVESVRRYPLLWVSGESGSGKSSLLRLGLVPALREKDFVPLYIDNWGSDWEAGPIASVMAELQNEVKLLGAELAVTARPKASDLAGYLEQAATKLSRQPVLILDQFDDYIVDNIDRFRPPGGLLIATAIELEHLNSFWKQIARLLRHNIIRCLLVVRQEQSWGEGAVSFIPIREIFIPRLRSEFLDQILRDLGPHAVEHPENGWRHLRERLATDLYSNGGILPIQMRVVARQLASLNNLTVRAYEGAGEAQGLAAGYVKEAIERTAGFTGVKSEVIAAILRLHVNPEEPTKTRDLVESEISAKFPGVPVNRVLERMRAEEILRERPNETGERRWRLDHDFFAGAIEELDRRDKGVQRVLERSSQAYRHGQGRRRSEYLIGPWALIRILGSALLGRVTVGDRWPVVLVSTANWLLVVLLLFGFTWWRLNRVFHTTADSYVAALRHSSLPVDVETWRQLAKEPRQVRQLVERRLVLDDQWGRSAQPERDEIAAAAFGGLSAHARLDFQMPEIDCKKYGTNGCAFLASQFGQDAEAYATAIFNLDWRGRDFVERFNGGWGENERFLLIRDVARFAPHAVDACFEAALGRHRLPLLVCSFTYQEPSEQSIALLRTALQVTPHEDFKSEHEISLHGPHLPETLSAESVLKLLASVPRISAGSLGPECAPDRDIRVSLKRLSDLACAPFEFELQSALLKAAQSSPLDVDRWTFAAGWLKQHASEYGLDPEANNHLWHRSGPYLIKALLPDFSM
jgi:hypothetical protein